MLAQVWLVVNCVLLCGGAGTLALLLSVHLPWLWITGQPLPDRLQGPLAIAGFVGGFALGGLGATWILHRAGRHGLRWSLITLSLIPVVGTGVSIICGVYFLWVVARRHFRGGGAPGVDHA